MSRGKDVTGKRAARAAAVAAGQNVSNTLKDSQSGPSIGSSKKLNASAIPGSGVDPLSNSAKLYTESHPPIEQAQMEFAKLPKHQIISYIRVNKLYPKDPKLPLHKMDTASLSQIASEHFRATELNEKDAILWFLYRGNNLDKELLIAPEDLATLELPCASERDLTARGDASETSAVA